jgi:hypothetical protein
VVSFDFSPSTIVRIDLAVRKFVSHLWILPFIPYWCNLWRSLLCGTVSLQFCIAPILQIILQQFLHTGDLPKDWRDANISSIFKKGDKHLPENYRPVSLI